MMNFFSSKNCTASPALPCNLQTALRQQVIKTAMLLLLTIAAVVGSDFANAEEKPNIIFIFADDWGYGDLSCHESTFCQTPHLDQMAKEGIDFSNFTVNSPVCTPSRVAVMTGHFPARYCIHQHFQGIKAHIKRGMPDWLPAQGPMLPRMMQDAGYKTGHFGKWHLGSVADSPSEAAYGYDRFATFNGSGENEISAANLSSVDHAEKFIKDFKDEPFFINLWLHEVHLPHFPQPKYMEKFKDLDEQKQVYASVIAEGDEGVGRVMALLKELNLDEKTLVVFTTDNGPEATRGADEKTHGKREQGLGGFYSVGETGGLKGQKRSLFAGGVRVPFIVRWPGVVPAGQTDSTSVITAVDMLPTFLAVAGSSPPEDYEADGENVFAAFKGEPITRTKPIFWQWRGGENHSYTWPSEGIRDGKWKMLVNAEQKKVELYDLDEDWAEKKDVAKENPEVVTKLKEELATWTSSLPTSPGPGGLSQARAKASKKKAAK